MLVLGVVPWRAWCRQILQPELLSRPSPVPASKLVAVAREYWDLESAPGLSNVPVSPHMLTGYRAGGHARVLSGSTGSGQWAWA
jgi:hypothetical protein